MTIPQYENVAKFFVVVCLSMGKAAIGVDELTRTRFLDAVEETRDRIEESGFSCDAKIEHRFKYESISAKKRDEVVAAGRDPDAEQIRDYRIMLSGANTMELKSKSPPAEVVTARNAQYSFLINRRDQSSTYSIGGLEQNDEGSVSTILDIVDEARGLALANWYVNSEPLHRLVTSSAFRLIDAREIDMNGTKAVKIDFDRADPRNVLRDFGPSYLICDPSQHWAMIEYELKVGPTAVQHVEIANGELINGFPVATRVVRRTFGKDKETIPQITLNIELVRTSVSANEFRLTHYGLPEPIFSGPSRWTWIWYLVGGISLIAIGMRVRRQRQRIESSS